jgi:hypothetical protein
MNPRLTPEAGHQSLNAHAAAKGREIREKYGPRIGWNELLRILADRTCVRYPCELVFDAGRLLPGEFAHPVAKQDLPEGGFTLYVHPRFAQDLDRVPYVALYALVRVNYGEFASAEDAESFGANALGLSQDEYYQTLCEMADAVEAPVPDSPSLPPL